MLIDRFFTSLNDLICSASFKDKHRLDSKNFIRKRKMSFEEIIQFILNIPKKSLPIELGNHFKRMGMDKMITISKQAFSNARQNISSSAFQELYYLTTDIERLCTIFKKWHGHQLLAIDGTTLQVPDTDENRAYFGYQSNHREPMAMLKVSALYDPLNDIIADVSLSPYSTSEKKQAFELIHKQVYKNSDSAPIFLFDRGYPSRELIQEIERNNCLYLMRCRLRFIRSINECPLGDHDVMDTFKEISTRIRVIKFQLTPDTVEILITNIFDPEYTQEVFKELYFKRWGIETKYGEIKNRIRVENFSGKKPITVEQDFYAALFLSNIVAIFKEDLDDKIGEIKTQKKTEKTYQANRNYLIGILLENLFALVLGKVDRYRIIADIFEKSLRNRSQVRPNRTREHKTKHNRAYNSPNYKPSH